MSFCNVTLQAFRTILFSLRVGQGSPINVKPWTELGWKGIAYDGCLGFEILLPEKFSDLHAACLSNKQVSYIVSTAIIHVEWAVPSFPFGMS